MRSLEEIEWDGPDTFDAIRGAGIQPLLHLTEVIDRTIDDEYDNEPTSLYWLNVAMRNLLEKLDFTMERVSEEYGYEVNYKDKEDTATASSA